MLQEKSFRKVGGTRDIPCSATIIASSNRHLLEETEKGRFRRDLYYRLAIFPIRIPPLRDESRRDDISLLAEYFVHTLTEGRPSGVRRVSDEAMCRLVQYNWPGNVREIRNIVERALILETSHEITSASLIFDHGDPLAPPVVRNVNFAPVQAKDFSLETAEREFILRALKETGWQRTRAAMLLGITRATLHAKLKRYDIRIPDDKSSPSDSGEFPAEEEIPASDT